RLPTCYSPVRRSSTPKGLSARLACVKHAASVRPEPGSNSPLMNSAPRGRESLPPWRRSAVVPTIKSQLACSCPSSRQIRPSCSTSPNGDACLPCAGHMALTFGTLLSSQGTNAHRSRPRGRSRGNSPNLPASGSWCQTSRFAPTPCSTLLRTRRCRADPSRWGPRSVLQRVEPLLSGAPGAEMKLRGCARGVKWRGRHTRVARRTRPAARVLLTGGAGTGTSPRAPRRPRRACRGAGPGSGRAASPPAAAAPPRR
ncbi:MAG: hypothetical protein JWM62_1474, partial [Frankiales bacterium]|nr:hypothetical protein [Frankiales bacterium]